LSAAAPARAADALCDPSTTNCRTQLLTLIQNERVASTSATGSWPTRATRMSCNVRGSIRHSPAAVAGRAKEPVASHRRRRHRIERDAEVVRRAVGAQVRHVLWNVVAAAAGGCEPGTWSQWNHYAETVVRIACA